MKVRDAAYAVFNFVETHYRLYLKPVLTGIQKNIIHYFHIITAGIQKNIVDYLHNTFTQIKGITLKSVFSFSDWAERITPRNLLWGVLPSLNTILMVLLYSCLITTGFVVLSNLWGAPIAFSSVFFPTIKFLTPSFVGLVMFNFIFTSDLAFVFLNGKPIHKLTRVETNIELLQMMRHVTAEVYCVLEKDPQKRLKTIPMPRICTYSNKSDEIKTCIGITVSMSAIYIPIRLVNTFNTKMKQHHLAALLQKEIVKIYTKQGYPGFFYNIISELGKNIENLILWESTGVLEVIKAAACITVFPLNFIFLMDKMIRRSLEVKAGEVVCLQTYRGADTITATSRVSYPGLKEPPPKVIAQLYKRPPFHGEGLLRDFYDWTDTLELPGQQENHRLVHFPGNLIRSIGLLWNEFYGPLRGNTERNFCREVIGGDIDGVRMFLQNADIPQTKNIKRQQREKNQTLYNEILEYYPNYIYPPLAPDASKKVRGWKSDDIERLSQHLETQQGQLTEQQSQIANQQSQIQELTQTVEILKTSSPPVLIAHTHFSHSQSIHTAQDANSASASSSVSSASGSEHNQITPGTPEIKPMLGIHARMRKQLLSHFTSSEKKYE